MKIVIFYKYFRTYGGQEKVIYNLVHYLADMGYEIDVYAIKIDDLPRKENIRLHRVFLPSNGWPSLLGFAIYSYVKGKVLKKKEPSVCIMGFGKTFYNDIYRSGGGVHRYYFKRAVFKYESKLGRFFYKLKKYLTLSHWITIWIEDLTYRSGQKTFIVPSLFVKKQIESFGIEKNRIAIIRNGVDINRFKPDNQLRYAERKKLGIAMDEFVFSFVSTNHRLKGLQYLLKAVRILKEEGYRFKLLIAGEDINSFFKKRMKGIEDYVVWLGRRKDIENVYNASDVFIYPTLFDTSALVILEAMACGNVPIVSIYAGSSELIKEGYNGFLISEPSNPLKIASSMKLVLDNPEIIKSLRLNAIETVRKQPQGDVFLQIEMLIRDKCGS
ncbi:glycosyltransferase family 4 protein [Hippea sp. KM1]|uniref:glycosyltransferase family 4 protein n=1 Tax=Hippea sp. KM1 TaxID=944481 RepID=UPI00046D26EF|nr:glycosyltransferase family 4 protein [Hippea sp. KM1]